MRLNKKTENNLEEFIEINEKFEAYKKTLWGLIMGYIFFYFFWTVLSFFVVNRIIELGHARQWGTNLMLAVAVPAIILIRGVLFCLDGIVTSKLKFPLGQICFVINNCKLLVKNEKEAIIEDITEANEHCKETLKKFGALTVGDEVRGVLKIIRKTEQPGGSNLLIDILLNISYGFPLYLAYGKTTEIEKVLAKITKRLKGYFRQERRKKYEELEEPEITSEESEEEENQSRKIKIKPKRKGKKEGNIFISVQT